MPNVTTAIRNFLRARANDNNRDLIARWTPAMETQVNIQKADGWPAKDDEGNQLRSTYENGTFRWWNIRVPKKANSEPEWNDYELNWPLDLFAEAIGSTGWDWQERVSRWLGFDFDSITGHAEGHGISKEQLERVKELACTLPYVEVRKSTGGAGLHLYVLVDAIPTANHDEHSALARCVLSKMSSECGFDFTSQNGMKIVDVFGGNMWIWHRKMTAENEGLKLLKASEHVLTTDDLPANWRDAVPTDGDDFFDLITRATYEKIELDDRHKAMIAEACRLGYASDWIDEKRCWNTHTVALREMAERIGVEFSTSSAGSDKAQANCFCYATDYGWIVYRFGGATEDATWLTANGQTFRDFILPTTNSPSRRRLIESFRFPQLRQAYPTLNPPVIDGLLRQGETCNVISASKIGKSWFGYGLLLAVASGQKWLGRFDVSSGEVGLIDNELHKETLSNRITTVADEMQVNDDVLRKLTIWPLRGNLRSLEEMERELVKIGPGRYKLLVFDALYRFAREGVSENDNSEMARVYNTLDRIAERTKAGIVIVHHSTKGNQSNKRVTDVGAGGGAQSRAADCHLILREHEQDGTMVLDAVVRSFKPIEPVAIEWDHPLWRPSDADPRELKIEPTRGSFQQEARDNQAMDAIRLALVDGPLTERKLRDRIGIAQDRVIRLAAKMEPQGLLGRRTIRAMNGREATEYYLPA